MVASETPIWDARVRRVVSVAFTNSEILLPAPPARLFFRFLTEIIPPYNVGGEFIYQHPSTLKEYAKGTGISSPTN